MYFPKSQIKTNLYTSTNSSDGYSNPEYVLSTTEDVYVGFYYELTNGQKFTGKYPGDGPNILLIKKDKSGNIPEYTSGPFIYYYDNGGGDSKPSQYTQIKNLEINNISYLPQYFTTIPTNKDYQTGEYTRYFCKKINELLYVEISKDYYTKLTKQDTSVAFEYYLPFNIPWRLAGKVIDVYNTNRNIVALTMKKQKLSMFNKYLKEDYTKYYK